MATYHYDGDQVTIVVMGVALTEFAEGDFCSVSLTGDDWEVTQGHHGAVIRAKRPNNLAEMTLQIVPGSPVNDQLDAAIDNDLTTGAGATVCTVKDLNGRSAVNAAHSWCKKRPDVKLGTTRPMVEYVFQLSDLEQTVGGNRSA